MNILLPLCPLTWEANTVSLIVGLLGNLLSINER